MPSPRCDTDLKDLFIKSYSIEFKPFLGDVDKHYHMAIYRHRGKVYPERLE